MTDAAIALAQRDVDDALWAAKIAEDGFNNARFFGFAAYGTARDNFVAARRQEFDAALAALEEKRRALQGLTAAVA